MKKSGKPACHVVHSNIAIVSLQTRQILLGIVSLFEKIFFKGLVARSHSLLVFFIKYIHTHSFITFAEFRSGFFISVRSGRGPPLGCRAEIRTRGRLTAARRAKMEENLSVGLFQIAKSDVCASIAVSCVVIF